jgi:hypothetical protein
LAFANHIYFRKHGIKLLLEILAKTKRDDAVELYKSAIPIITLYDSLLIQVGDNILDYLGADEDSETADLLRNEPQHSPKPLLDNMFQGFCAKWNQSIFERDFIIPNSSPYSQNDCVDLLNDNLEFLANLSKDDKKSNSYNFMWDLFQKEILVCLLPRINPIIESDASSISLKVCPAFVLKSLLNFLDKGMIPNDDDLESSRWLASRQQMWTNVKSREVFIEIIRQCTLLPLAQYDIISKSINLLYRTLFSVFIA